MEKRERRSSKKQPMTPELLKGRIMLRISEWAQLTGTPLPTAYSYATSGKIPIVRIGGTLRVPVAAVLEQLNAAGVAA